LAKKYLSIFRKPKSNNFSKMIIYGAKKVLLLIISEALLGKCKNLYF